MTAAEIYETARYFFPPPPSAEFYASDAARLPRSSGVYFIYEGVRIVYVGESVCLRDRLSCHEHATQSRMVSFIECDRHQRKRLESFYIGLLNPPLNSQSTERCRIDRIKASGKSLCRRAYEHVTSNPGCSLSELRKAIGWKHRSAKVRSLIQRMTEWGFICEHQRQTKGRTKRTYFASDAEAVA